MSPKYNICILVAFLFGTAHCIDSDEQCNITQILYNVSAEAVEYNLYPLPIDIQQLNTTCSSLSELEEAVNKTIEPCYAGNGTQDFDTEMFLKLLGSADALIQEICSDKDWQASYLESINCTQQTIRNHTEEFMKCQHNIQQAKSVEDICRVGDKFLPCAYNVLHKHCLEKDAKFVNAVAVEVFIKFCNRLPSSAVTKVGSPLMWATLIVPYLTYMLSK